MSLPPWPAFDSDEIERVARVLRSGRVNYWTGTLCREFERSWSGWLAQGAERQLHSVCFANGTLTLQAALHALAVGPGDEVIVPSRTYVADALCVAMAGATPVFADVDPQSGCITAESAEAARTVRTRAIIPVHLGGWPCDMPTLCEWSQQHGIEIIEDCAQAHGAQIDGRPVGTFGSIASWSFCQDKIITTGGEGGMLSVRDPELLRRCWSYAQHGKDHDQALDLHGRASAPGFKWLVEHQGTNCRMTEMQAAIGLAQLSKLSRWIDARRRNAHILHDALADIPGVRAPAIPPGHACYRFTFYVEAPGNTASEARDAVLQELHYAGLPASVGSCGEIYREPYFQSLGLAPREPLPVARRLAETSLALPCHPTIDADTMRAYAKEVRKTMCASLSDRPLIASRQLDEVRA